MTLSGGKLAGGNPKNNRIENDFYATDPKALEMLLKKENFDLSNVLEPCVGNGTLANLIKSKQSNSDELFAIDIVDRGYANTIVADFLNIDFKDYKFSSIITNPPYSLAKEFVEKCLSILKQNGKIAMFLKIQFLEGAKRKELFENFPPKYIYVFRNRMATWNNGNPTDPETGNVSEPIVRWL